LLMIYPEKKRVSGPFGAYANFNINRLRAVFYSVITYD
jgi:hypothetical protein